ncbi:MAG: hypothetical protein Q9218_000631 [Villophora microphyllina]
MTLPGEVEALNYAAVTQQPALQPRRAIYYENGTYDTDDKIEAWKLAVAIFASFALVLLAVAIWCGMKHRRDRQRSTPESLTPDGIRASHIELKSITNEPHHSRQKLDTHVIQQAMARILDPNGYRKPDEDTEAQPDVCQDQSTSKGKEREEESPISKYQQSSEATQFPEVHHAGNKREEETFPPENERSPGAAQSPEIHHPIPLRVCTAPILAMPSPVIDSLSTDLATSLEIAMPLPACLQDCHCSAEEHHRSQDSHCSTEEHHHLLETLVSDQSTRTSLTTTGYVSRNRRKRFLDG